MSSSLFFTRRSPAARLHSAYRRYRSTPKHGLVGPVVLAVSLAAAGHQVAAAASAATGGTQPVAASSAQRLVTFSDHRTAVLLGEPLTSAAVVPAPTPSTALALGARQPLADRASRSAPRTAVAKPKPKAAPKPRWTRPSGGPLTSPYGMRWGRMHRGLDFGAPQGAPVRAAYDGVITMAGYDGGGYGKQIRIRHSGGIVTTYSHLSKFVRTGGRVKAGEVIGKVGSTGNSTGPHLHFEILVGGANVNPRAFLASRGVRA